MVLWIATLTLLAVVTWSLRHRGRPWHRNRYSQRSIDGWSVTHFGHGIVLFGLARMTFDWDTNQLVAAVLIIEALWESVENRNWLIKLFRAGGDKNYFGDSVCNSAGDLAACTAGALFTTLFI